MEKEGARVFHAPLDVGDRQMRSGGEATVLDGYLRGQGDVMILAMNSQDPMNTYLALTRQRQLTGETVRRRPEPMRGGVGPANRLALPPDAKRPDAGGQCRRLHAK